MIIFVSCLRQRKGMSKLGILILSEPREADVHTIQGLCREAIEVDVEVEIFLMSDAVNYLLDHHVETLLKEGARIRFCTLNTRERQIDSKIPDLSGLETGSQYTLACLVESADRFIAFT